MKLVLRIVTSACPALSGDYLNGLEERAEAVLRQGARTYDEAFALAAYLDAVDAEELAIRRLLYRAATDALCAWMLASPQPAARLAASSWAAASLAQFLAEPCMSRG